MARLNIKHADDYSQTLFPEYLKETEMQYIINTPQTHTDPFHLEWLQGMTLTDYGMPQIEAYNDTLPARLIPFHEARAGYYSGVATTGCPHFYIEDSRFMCLLNDLPKYTTMLSCFPMVITPDFSIKMDMPEPMKMYNSYLNKVIGRYLQLHNVSTIPNVVWAGPNSYHYCFAGYPKGSVVAVNSMGIKGDSRSVFFWLKGYEEMLTRLRPSHIIRYGEMIPGENVSISTFYSNNHLNRMRHGR